MKPLDSEDYVGAAKLQDMEVDSEYLTLESYWSMGANIVAGKHGTVSYCCLQRVGLCCRQLEVLGDARLDKIMSTPIIDEYCHAEIVDKAKEFECLRGRCARECVKAYLGWGRGLGGGYSGWWG